MPGPGPTDDARKFAENRLVADAEERSAANTVNDASLAAPDQRRGVMP